MWTDFFLRLFSACLRNPGKQVSLFFWKRHYFLYLPLWPTTSANGAFSSLLTQTRPQQLEVLHTAPRLHWFACSIPTTLTPSKFQLTGVILPQPVLLKQESLSSLFPAPTPPQTILAAQIHPITLAFYPWYHLVQWFHCSITYRRVV